MKTITENIFNRHIFACAPFHVAHLFRGEAFGCQWRGSIQSEQKPKGKEKVPIRSGSASRATIGSRGTYLRDTLKGFLESKGEEKSKSEEKANRNKITCVSI